MASRNGDSARETPLELGDTLVIGTQDKQERLFEVLALFEDEEGHNYAVCSCDETAELIVTDEFGGLVNDPDLVDEVMADFTDFAEEAGASEGTD
ncbi:MAG: hypothetical protein JO018_02715 [Candidatus Eremiobacteraeota bacterium]|nr:hypothetical protein [Candidatus Eremiobacteraeota bacterium]